MSDNRRLANLFEKRISVDAIHQRVFAIQIPQAGRFGSGGFGNSPIDFSLGVDGKALYFDAKVTQDRLWNLKEYVLSPKKIHQFHQLVRAHECGNAAGYLINFKPYELISWVPIVAIENCLKENLKAVTPDSKFVISQDEGVPIMFRELFWGKDGKDISTL